MTTKKINKKETIKKGIGKTIGDAKYIIGGIMVVLALAASIFSFDSRYFKTAEAQQQQQQIYKSFDEFQLKGEMRNLSNEQRRLYDRQRDLKRDLERYPNDRRLKEDLENVQRDIEDNKKEIADTKKQLAPGR